MDLFGYTCLVTVVGLAFSSSSVELTVTFGAIHTCETQACICMLHKARRMSYFFDYQGSPVIS